MTEAIILAGGYGTRLRELVPDVPKPMAPVKGRPFLTYILDDLARQRIERAILATGYKHQYIADYLGIRYGGIDLEYSVEETPLGTGGAIRKAIKQTTGSAVYILNGDTFFPVDLSALRKTHQRLNAVLTLSLKRVDGTERYGRVLTQDHVVAGFVEKGGGGSGFINGGVYLANRDLFAGLAMPERFSFESDFLACYYQRLRFGVYYTDGYFIDIGIPDDYRRAQTELSGE